ncbi:MAG TPA: hypothetical protein DHV36_22795 [Desulfobacteraceae bacterium]|nr:hypothetical protein [Desulfobacteraceae bacterium]|tara:strand:- start:530 stop:826 length:297 start_codon:yes stop_codon:yes gene_type:complete
MENRPYTYQFKTEALAEHERLSRLFRENRFMFELERKKIIQRNISRIRKKALRKDLEEMQDQWDKIMKNAGSSHNRFVLMQTLLWDAVQNKWLPAIKK